MLDKKYYEQCYCPEGKDANFPENWTRKNYLLKPIKTDFCTYPSDSDLETIVSKLLPADPKLTNEALGVYLRLQLLDYFGYEWEEVYRYGNQKATEDALNLLLQEGYLQVYTNKTDNEQLSIRLTRI